jgi:hypothetical protein
MGHDGEPTIHHEGVHHKGVDLVGPARYDKRAALHPGAVHERRLGAGARQVTAVTVTRIPSTCRRALGSAKRPRAPKPAFLASTDGEASCS